MRRLPYLEVEQPIPQEFPFLAPTKIPIQESTLVSTTNANGEEGRGRGSRKKIKRKDFFDAKKAFTIA